MRRVAYDMKMIMVLPHGPELLNRVLVHTVRLVSQSRVADLTVVLQECQESTAGQLLLYGVLLGSNTQQDQVVD